MVKKRIELEEGWDCVQKGITKLKRIVDGLNESPFTSEEYMNLYTTIYNTYFKNPHDYPQQLYVKFCEEVEGYITGSVLPSLREKHDEFLLRELVKVWENYKVMVKRLSCLFYCIEYVIVRNELPAFNEVGLTCFRDLVFRDGKVRDAVITLLDKEREGEQIDRALLKNVTDIFVEIGMGKLDAYEEDFEAQMLQDSGAFYSHKASNWILEDSCPDYMLKAEKCFKEERDRVIHYLHSSSELKLVKRVQHELLVVYANQLLENEHFGCRTLLRDDKVEDLSRIYRLYHKIPHGLEPIANIFKQLIAAEGTALVQQFEDAASNQIKITAEYEADIIRLEGCLGLNFQRLIWKIEEDTHKAVHCHPHPNHFSERLGFPNRYFFWGLDRQPAEGGEFREINQMIFKFKKHVIMHTFWKIGMMIYVDVLDSSDIPKFVSSGGSFSYGLTGGPELSA